MAFSTSDQVRACDKKLSDETDITDTDIDSRITEADNTIYVDLSPIASEDDLTTAGSTSKVLNLLSTWKAVELTLAQYFGASRNVDQVSDIQYWQKKYNDLLKKVLEGEVKIISGTTEYSATNAPVITDSSYRLKLYPRKGMEDFTPDGADEAYVDDEK